MHLRIYYLKFLNIVKINFIMKIFRNLLANITILMGDNILVSVILMKWNGVDVATHILTDM